MQDLVRGWDLYGWIMWHAMEPKIPYIPALIVEWEITTVDTMKMLVLFAEVSYGCAALCCPSSVMMSKYAQLDYFLVDFIRVGRLYLEVALAHY